MDAFITWFRQTLELRFAAAWAANGEEDFDVFESKRDAYFARHVEDARSSIFCDREDDDDISFLALPCIWEAPMSGRRTIHRRTSFA
jgi:hypothetical protein